MRENVVNEYIYIYIFFFPLIWKLILSFCASVGSTGSTEIFVTSSITGTENGLLVKAHHSELGGRRFE